MPIRKVGGTMNNTTTIASSSSSLYPCSPNEVAISPGDCVGEGVEEWLEDETLAGFRVWQLAGIVLSIILAIIIALCCCIRFRIPRTKQDIEADYIRKRITKNFRKELDKINNAEMDEMDLRRGEQSLQILFLLQLIFAQSNSNFSFIIYFVCLVFHLNFSFLLSRVYFTYPSIGESSKWFGGRDRGTWKAASTAIQWQIERWTESKNARYGTRRDKSFLQNFGPASESEKSTTS